MERIGHMRQCAAGHRYLARAGLQLALPFCFRGSLHVMSSSVPIVGVESAWSPAQSLEEMDKGPRDRARQCTAADARASESSPLREARVPDSPFGGLRISLP